MLSAGQDTFHIVSGTFHRCNNHPSQNQQPSKGNANALLHRIILQSIGSATFYRFWNLPQVVHPSISPIHPVGFTHINRFCNYPLDRQPQFCIHSWDLQPPIDSETIFRLYNYPQDQQPSTVIVSIPIGLATMHGFSNKPVGRLPSIGLATIQRFCNYPQPNQAECMTPWSQNANRGYEHYRVLLKGLRYTVQ